MQDLTTLSTEYPILLFPVQVQVKFLAPAAGPPELRVRFYPDQLGLSSHEPGLSAPEAAAGQAYWRQDDEPGPRTGPHALGSWRRLVAAYGAPRAAWIVEQTTPTNLSALAAGTAPTPQFGTPLAAGPLLQTPPRTLVMPDYFTVTLYQQHETAAGITDPPLQSQLLGNLAAPYSPATFPEPTTEFLYPVKTVQGSPIPNPLPVGFGLAGVPDEAPGTAPLTHPLTGLDDRMAWLVDYDQAVAQGLAVTIPLTADEYAQGFKRLVVLGVRAAGDATAQARVVQDVFQAHAHTDGLALVAQGTPTNNTDSHESGYGSNEQFNADATFPLLTQGAAYRARPANLSAERVDGRRLSDALGLPATAFEAVGGALMTDAQEAIQLNRALWPATYGYFLEEMMRPLFSPAAIDWVRHFFEPQVLGRGPLPALRVGNTPYGVLPTTRFSAWAPAASLGSYGQQLARTLRHLDVTWTERLNKAGNYPQATEAGAPLPAQPTDYQSLLTALGSEATSVEFYQRYMLGPNLVDTLGVLAQARGRSIWPGLRGPNGTTLRRTLNRFGVPGAAANPLHQEFLRLFDPGDDLGLRGAGEPHIFAQTFQRGYAKLLDTFADEPAAATGQGLFIDEFPFSETDAVRPFPGTEINFIQWLAADETSFDDIRREDFSKVYPDGPPTEFTPPNSLLYRLLRQAVLQQYWDLAARVRQLSAAQRTEPEFFNVFSRLRTRWQGLYEPVGAGGPPLHAYLRDGTGSEGQQLVAYLRQLGQLALLPTARLERLLAEHLDLGNHRLDAWKIGQVAHRLDELRQAAPAGLYYGAFGWLEDLRATDRSVAGADGIRTDPDNLGYIHAPSPNQAVTAAILRQGYKSRQLTTDPADPASNRLAVNLSSARVREAMAILEGIRGGASLSALLGRHFEQGLTRTGGQVNNRPYAAFLRYFRIRFPYALEKASLDPLAATGPTGAAAPEQAARQVVDGLALLRAGAALSYPYDVAGLPTDEGLAAAVRQQVAALQDTVDALGDLAVSEGVFHATQGNADRAGAVLESIAKGKFPVSPEMVTPPQAGKALTQRVLLHLPGADSPALSNWGATRTPRARAEPGLNRWLAAFFGDPRTVTLTYEYRLGEAPNVRATPGSLGLLTLQLQPIDLLFLLEPDALRAGSALDALLTEAARQQEASTDPSASGAVALDYTTGGAQQLRQLLPLASRLRQLLGSSRAARPEDLSAPGQGATGQGGAIEETEVRARLQLVQDELQALATALPGAPGPGVPAAPPAPARVREVRGLLRQAVLLGLAEAVAALGAVPDQLLAAVGTVQAALVARLAGAARVLADPEEEVGRRLEDAARELLGREFRLSLPFTLAGSAATAYQQAIAREGKLRNGNAGTLVGSQPLLMQEWLQGLARVREPLDHLDNVLMLHELTWGEDPAYTPLPLTPAQLSTSLPAPDQEWWLGMGYPADYVPAGDVVSLVQLRPAAYDAAGRQQALWLDEWTETLPEADATTAVAFHYDQPNAEPPQTLLLAVAPQPGPGTAWAFDELLGTVNETLDLAKRRTVEPDSLAASYLGALLPALVAPVAQQGVTFTLDFRRLRGAAQYQEAPVLPDPS